MTLVNLWIALKTENEIERYKSTLQTSSRVSDTMKHFLRINLYRKQSYRKYYKQD